MKDDPFTIGTAAFQACMQTFEKGGANFRYFSVAMQNFARWHSLTFILSNSKWHPTKVCLWLRSISRPQHLIRKLWCTKVEIEIAMQSYFYLLDQIDIWWMNWKELCIWMKTQKRIIEIGSKLKKLWVVKNVYHWYLFATPFSLFWQKHVLHCKNINLLISKQFNKYTWTSL